jgi:hypothetical protein
MNKTIVLLNKLFIFILLLTIILSNNIFAQNIIDTATYYKISRNEIRPILFKDNRAITNHPDWKMMKKNVQKKYPEFKDVNLLMTNEKINFYRTIKNWNTYTKIQSREFKLHPPAKGSPDVFFQLNARAWDAFLHCSHTPSLKRALTWSNLSITLDNNVQFLDTKACLLYKLGKRKEALDWEQKAVDITKTLPHRDGKGQPLFMEDYMNTIEKMKRGEILWPAN